MIDIKPIFEKAEIKMNQSFNSPDMVPYAREILESIEVDGKSEGYIQQFKLAWFEKWGPDELTSICMHKLRWNELKEFFEALHRQAIEKNDWRAQPCLAHILDAFEDDWEDAQDFYYEYFGPET